MSLHVVRHAEAGDRSAWDGPDELRPLSSAGMAQAEALADTLAAVPLDRILTSRYVRCAQTVAPLGERRGVKAEEHEALVEEADVEDTLALMEELGGAQVVLCTHGNLIGPLLDRLHRRGVELVAEQWVCEKSSVWTVDVDASGAFTGARYIPPPA